MGDAGVATPPVGIGLDGGSEYDFVLDRQTSPRKPEAYRRDGQLLRAVDVGAASTSQNTIEGGSSTIDVGHHDGVPLYDFDSDGRFEFTVRIAGGGRFGDGTTDPRIDDERRFVALLDGMTWTPRVTAPVPMDYLADGPMYVGVGYLDGARPSPVALMKGRRDNTGPPLVQWWNWLRGSQYTPDGHCPATAFTTRPATAP
ncbi:hypothetical protein ABTX60_21785 [Streptomyces sp. NPDC126510]|uniref:hypothetical protein n=1 Tax=Streptomyces sp. NPDC126510 TaxID=3155317 RepID=UPI00332A915E